MSLPATDRTPAWMTVVIIVMMLPLFLLPSLLSAAPSGDDTVTTILWCYPFYVMLSGWLAWICYPSRPVMSWILLALMLLSHIAVWILVDLPLS